MNRLAFVIVFALAALTSFAQDRAITAAERRQLGEIVPHLLDTMYVIPEKGTELAAKVRASFAGGRYDSATTASALAQAINSDLAIANDKHLGIHHTGKDPSAPLLTVDAWNERRAAMHSGQPMPRPQNQDASRMVNYGVVSAQVLEGNVGYLKMREFMDSEKARAALSSAMGFLAHTDAMIVDVRNCRGGSADTVSYLASYFFDSEKRVLMNRFNRPMNRRMDSTTVDVPGKRMPATDLYVLTGSTGSACESFAFTLQQWGRARTVGEKTSGAGNNNMFINLGGGFNLSISIGSAVHPKTGKAFEAVGVLPDIEAPASRALEAAHAEALRKLSRAAVRGDAIAEVRAIEREWLDAYEKRDAVAMNRIVADDFMIVHGDGRKQTKPEVMASLARSASGGMPAAKFTTDEVVARAYGDAVVLTGRVTMEMTRRDGTTSRRASRYTDTYVKNNGRWQVVASHQGSIDASAPATPTASTQSAPPPAIKLDEYTGKYGVREVTIRDGALHYQRVGGQGGTLKPLARDQFDLNGDVVITFKRDDKGAVNAMGIQWKDGRTEVVPREP